MDTTPVQRLREAAEGLVRGGPVLAACACGSRVAGRPRPPSDVDVGCGLGGYRSGQLRFLREELRLASSPSDVVATPTMRGTLFDLPHLVEGAAKHLAAVGVGERSEVVPGSFFDSVPAGADAYVLKSVLHDWNDERAAVILTNCRRAMAGRAKLLVVERVLPERMEPSAEHRLMAASDLAMMVAAAGRERTAAEFRALFRSTGFVLTRIVPAAARYSLIEGACS